MTSRNDVLVEAGRLAGEGKPFALATVVNVERPASARRGDRALVTPDGALIGWVGGACSEPMVLREALRALADRRPRLVRIGKSAGALEPPADMVVAESPCASEGTVDVLVEPCLPAPVVAVVGESPTARTLAELARTIGWRVSPEVTEGADAVVVATMGRSDEAPLAAALERSAGYVGLVASSRRARAVLDALRRRGLDDEAVARVRSPAGLDLGPARPEEIAVAILAELVAWLHARASAGIEFAEVVDPVCGSVVSAHGAGERSVYEGVAYSFCCGGCRSRFEEDPARFVSTAAP